MYEISIPALKVDQPLGRFFIGVINHHDLIDISKTHIREMDKELDQFMGIQRKLDKKRVKDIGEYIHNLDASFPTSIILSIEEDNCSWSDKNNILTIHETRKIPKDGIAQILDGQHRIEGLKSYNNSKPFELTVAIFIGADISTQANIFATVNLAQTKVNRSLVYDLFSLDNVRSPQKSCHEITVALNKYEKSPFFKRIKRLGRATPGEKKEILTQAVMVESLLPFITSNPNEDRNTFLKSMGLSKANNNELLDYPFRNLWLSEDESKITKIILNYFDAVSNIWPHAWDDYKRQGNVLPKSNGIRALMRYLKLVYPDIVNFRYGSIPDIHEFVEVLRISDLQDSDFNIEKFPPGKSGEAGFFKILKSSFKK